MPFESEAAAAEALANANTGSEYAEAPAASPDSTVEHGATTEDSFTSIDPSVLPAELQHTYKQMQADYTRKTQEIAPWRKLGDGITPDLVQEALTLRDSLQNPDVQRQLYEHLNGMFSEQEESPEDFDESGFSDPRDAVLSQLQQRLETFEMRQIQAEVDAELNRAESAIREQNPNWTDTDMQTVAQFALAHNGDLLQGAEAYKSLQQRLLKSYTDGKASVSPGVTTPQTTGHAEVPQKFSSLDEAHLAAMSAWRASQL